MSFGRPPTNNFGFSVSPPDRGSFPLDHFGECKQFMTEYLKCLKANGSSSTPCRLLSKSYLDCRMRNGLMEPDEWKNLGLANVGDEPSSAASAPQSARDGTATAGTTTDNGPPSRSS